MKHSRTHLVTTSSSHALNRGLGRHKTIKTLTSSIGEHMAGSLNMNPGPSRHTLSERELEVLVLIAQGRSVKHIAGSLMLSIKTVSTYRARLLDKLQLSTTAELIRYALDHHLVG